MNILELEKSCLSTCFRFWNGKLEYPKMDKILEYLIFYPIDGFYLKEKQFNLVMKSIKESNMDMQLFISNIEFEDSFTNPNKIESLGYEHNKFDIETKYEDYLNQQLLFEYAIYDINEKFGISVMQDQYAIIVGNKEIIQKIRKYYPFQQEKENFIKFINGGTITNIDFKNQIIHLVNQI